MDQVTIIHIRRRGLVARTFSLLWNVFVGLILIGVISMAAGQ